MTVDTETTDTVRVLIKRNPGPLGFTEPDETDPAMQVGVFVGRRTEICVGEAQKSISTQARGVRAHGHLVFIAGGRDQMISVDDARQLLNDEEFKKLEVKLEKDKKLRTRKLNPQT